MQMIEEQREVLFPVSVRDNHSYFMPGHAVLWPPHSTRQQFRVGSDDVQLRVIFPLKIYVQVALCKRDTSRDHVKYLYTCRRKGLLAFCFALQASEFNQMGGVEPIYSSVQDPPRCK